MDRLKRLPGPGIVIHYITNNGGQRTDKQKNDKPEVYASFITETFSQHQENGKEVGAKSDEPRKFLCH